MSNLKRAEDCSTICKERQQHWGNCDNEFHSDYSSDREWKAFHLSFLRAQRKVVVIQALSRPEPLDR